MTALRTSIEIAKDYLHFGAAHFTIFSATERENLHGHNFFVTADMNCTVGPDGLAFDYNVIKQELKALCDHLDEKVLLPESSPYLRLEQDGAFLIALFNGERIPFLPRDVLTLPISNITVEELAGYLLRQLINTPRIAILPLETLVIRVSSGPGQWAGAHWSKA
jgi:6-pyruvoyltetrahydropterin/6-carboxytetrahydropterin synthase